MQDVETKLRRLREVASGTEMVARGLEVILRGLKGLKIPPPGEMKLNSLSVYCNERFYKHFLFINPHNYFYVSAAYNRKSLYRNKQLKVIHFQMEKQENLLYFFPDKVFKGNTHRLITIQIEH